MLHFFLNLDETCIMACEGTLSVFGDAAKKKHEKTVDNSRFSIIPVFMLVVQEEAMAL